MTQTLARGNLTTLLFNFHWDRDFALSYVNSFQKWFPIFTLLTVHPMVFYVLLLRSTGYGSDIKWGYVVNQLCLLSHEFIVSFLFRMVNLIPYAGLYCDGPLCRLGLPQQALIVPLAFSFVSVVPPFQFLLFRMHNMIVSNSNTRIRFSGRAQAAIIAAESLLLLANVLGCAVFGRVSDDSADLLQRPELEWMTHRGGTVFMFGPPGYPQYFMYEGLVLFLCIAIIGPFIALLIIHSTIKLRKRAPRSQSSSKTQHMKNSVIAVFYAQMIVLFILYVCPLGVFLLYLAVDLSFLPWSLLALLRYLNMPVFMCEPLLLSLIFLLRNPNRRILVNSIFGRFCVRKSVIQNSVEITMAPHQTTNI